MFKENGKNINNIGTETLAPLSPLAERKKASDAKNFEIKGKIEKSLEYFSQPNLDINNLPQSTKDEFENLRGLIKKRFGSLSKACEILGLPEDSYRKMLDLRQKVLGLKRWKIDSAISRRNKPQNKEKPRGMFWLDVLEQVFFNPEGASFEPEVLKKNLPIASNNLQLRKRMQKSEEGSILQRNLPDYLRAFINSLKMHNDFPPENKNFLPKQEQEFFARLAEKWPGKTLDQIIAAIPGHEILESPPQKMF